MNIPKFTISRFEGPLLMRIEISQADVVDHDIFYQGIAKWVHLYRSMQICMLMSWDSFVCYASLF